MDGKQLNVWLPEELRNYVAQRAKQEKRGRNQIIADLIRQDMAQRKGQLVEQNSLVVMREIGAAELRQVHAQLHRDLREDREHEEESRREWVRKQVDRLAGLIIMAIRNSGIGRRLSYTLLSKAHGPDFASLGWHSTADMPDSSSAWLPTPKPSGESCSLLGCGAQRNGCGPTRRSCARFSSA